ncbi:PUS3-like protein [Mya arenaria]|uniref:tRNA pseudouridine synthase n=1 Tax=Mya arenaria TaxID=6604 RepID=A0ABY7EYT9_MYAAR|nr:PUS3-like protein [Mya arenaria]
MPWKAAVCSSDQRQFRNTTAELMLRIHQLETRVKVLQRASKEENPVAPPMPRMTMKRKKKFRPSDFHKYVVFLDVRGNLLSGVGVKLMEEAGKKLIGEYDFCNFCKFSVKDGITDYWGYVRKIMEVEVKTLDETDDGFTMCELTIVWRAFLWHQIRSIFSVLVLVGKGKESDDSSEEEMTSQKRQRLEIDKPSHIDDKPFGTLDKPKSGENKDPHIIYEENNKEDDDTIYCTSGYDTDQFDREYLTTNTEA